MCTQRVKAYSTRYHTIFFRIWAIWEERHYLKLFPSVQLWELRRENHIPSDPYDNLPILDLTKEFHLAAKEFFHEAYAQGTSIVHSV